MDVKLNNLKMKRDIVAAHLIYMYVNIVIMYNGSKGLKIAALIA